MKLSISFLIVIAATSLKYCRCRASELNQAATLFSGPVEVVSEDPRFAWLESPVWHESGKYLLFSDVQWRREEDDIVCGMLWKYDSVSGNVTKMLECSGIAGPPGPDAINGLPADIAELKEGGSNGLFWKKEEDGILLMNQHGWKRMVSLNVNDVDETTASIEPDLVSVVVDSYGGTPLNSPNDLVQSEKGDIYFTDPPFGLQYRTVDDPFGFSFELMTQDAPAVYKLSVGGDLERILQFEVSDDRSKRFGPNGIAINEQNGDVAVAITEFGNPRTEIYCRFDNGTIDVTNPCKTLLHDYRIEGPNDSFPPLVDGNTYDGDMHVLIISGPGGIYIYDTWEEELGGYGLLGFIRIDDLCSNNVVDGGYLWMTCNQRLLRIPLAEKETTTADGPIETSTPTATPTTLEVPA
eukprot:CAMPEP_0198294014 /NCGR_PEP_ID=MMETSP1449-20131203/20075_1 /TAXON_ID=420275 /ORGANISM="Attheya septentrionalis, Strain CCMP2084" /LENGTH=408 /DNA_ID=CAMNT_0043993815 /DNA_START=55 /DNA_END=1282 /DNA_ORIENTATION=-